MCTRLARLALLVLCLVTLAVAQDVSWSDRLHGQLRLGVLPDLEVHRGLVMLFLTGTGTYRVPQQCTGPAVMAMLDALEPHLKGAMALEVFFPVHVPPAEKLRQEAAEIEAREALIVRYQALRKACRAGE